MRLSKRVKRNIERESLRIKTIYEAPNAELDKIVVKLKEAAKNRAIQIIQEIIDTNESDPCPDETDIMTEIVYNITSLLFNKTRKEELRVQDVIIQIFGLSEHLGIDLEWHINQKMRYNELRPRLHGKEY